MITIGLTGWTDHELLILSKRRKLEDYASHFPFVEIDTSFYGIPSEASIQTWIEKTPNTFQFIPKAYSGMTLHSEFEKYYTSVEEMFDTFKIRFYPMLAAKKVKAFLFQFPPFFHCTQENIEYLIKIAKLMGPLPIAVEFRHKSWYSEENRDSTLKLLEKLFYIHVVVDQPQTPSNSVPTVLNATNNNLTLYRLHGKNYSGWLNASEDQAWRANRTLYDYTGEELIDIKNNTQLLEKQSTEVAVIFNNNSGGHAAKNAKELQELLNIKFEGLNPMQLNLF